MKRKHLLKKISQYFLFFQSRQHTSILHHSVTVISNPAVKPTRILSIEDDDAGAPIHLSGGGFQCFAGPSKLSEAESPAFLLSQL
jgi:hypothetical protein